MSRAIVLTHGGVGAAPTLADGPEAAAEAGMARLRAGGDALAAAIAATVVLEDDPRFNAGTGANLRLDGRTVELDAAVMSDDGRSGAVAGLRHVQNPVRVAAEVRGRTPHLLLVGPGALDFARACGFPPYDPTTDRARERLEEVRGALRSAGFTAEQPWGWSVAELVRLLPADPEHDLSLGDTVGAVVRDADGRFAAASSTGGTSAMLPGRVGDSPLLGCGLYAGPMGAVTATGVGEEIVRRLLSKTVYDWVAAGMDAAEAAARGVALFPDDVAIGLLVVGPDSAGTAANRDMPYGHISDPT